MAVLLKQSTSVVISFGPFVLNSDGVTLVTNLVGTGANQTENTTSGIRISKNGGAFAARHAPATASTYDAYGNYLVTLDTTDTGTLGVLRVQFQNAAAFCPVWQDFELVTANVYDSLVAGTDVLDISLIQWLGTAPNILQSGRVDSYLGAVATGVIVAASFAANALDAVWSTTTRLLTAGTNIVLAKGVGVTGFNDIAATDVVSGGAITTSGGAVSTVASVSSIAAGGISASSFAAGAIDATAIATDAIGANEFSQAAADKVWGTASRTLTAFGFSVTVGTNNDKTGYTLSVAGNQAIWDVLTTAMITANSIGKRLVDFVTTLVYIAPLDATATENAVWNATQASHVGAGTTGESLNNAGSGGTPPSVAQIVDGVWDELIAGHLGAGTTGNKLNSAGSAGDPWSTALPNGYAAGEAGFILGNLSAATFPVGAIEVTFTVLNSITSQPIDGARVWISTDLAGTNTIWSGTTNAFGIAINVNNEKPFLNAGTYYAWIQDSGYTDTNPTTLVVS